MEEGGRETHLGIVKFYNPRKGYGFVAWTDGPDVFFHLSHLRAGLAPSPGQIVSFRSGQNREGLTAEDVTFAADDALECYEGTITSLEPDRVLAATPDNFTIQFLRADFVPHTRAEALQLGDEVEMFLLEEAADRVWQARVARPAHFEPEALAPRAERREADEEEENRRLLGVLYKTDQDEEALQAARTLTERNMRATLSALASRAFDGRLAVATRRQLLDAVPRLFFDELCQSFLETMTAALQAVLDAEEAGSVTGPEAAPDDAEAAVVPAPEAPGDATEGGEAPAVAALRLLLDEEQFPIRWSQYLLPFGLSLLRDFAALPTSQAALREAAVAEAAERWLLRVCRHVEQRRSGYPYVLSTTFTTFDQVWQCGTLQEAVQRTLGRLLIALDAESLAQQFGPLRDRLSRDFLGVLLPLLSQHPDLPTALGAPYPREVFGQWVETLFQGQGEPLPTPVIATLLPALETMRSHLADDEAIQRLLQPVTETLLPDEVVRMLTGEDLPERAVWAMLRHLDRQGELTPLLADPAVRDIVTHWLRRTSQRERPEAPAEEEVTTALKLIDSLRGNLSLPGELQEIGESLFASLHERIAQANSDELLRLLDEFESDSLVPLAADLARRLRDDGLSDLASQRLRAFFGTLGAEVAGAAGVVAQWSAETAGPAELSEAIEAMSDCRRTGQPPGEALAGLLDELLATAEIGWHDGFVAALIDGPAGPTAQLAGVAIQIPRRLFVEADDFAPHRYVRLLHRRGMAVGVVPATVPETTPVCGRLAGPLVIDDRNAMVGELVAADGERCHFEASQLRSGQALALQTGDLLKFVRLPAPAGQAMAFVALNAHRQFSEADRPLLWHTFVAATDEAVALAAGREALHLGGADDSLAAEALATASAARRAALGELDCDAAAVPDPGTGGRPA